MADESFTERLWMWPYLAAMGFLAFVYFFGGGCDGGTQPVELVGLWMPAEKGQGLLLHGDGSGVVQEPNMDIGVGVPFRWAVRRGSLQFLGIGEEGDMDGPWETTGYLISDGRLSIEKPPWLVRRELMRVKSTVYGK